VWALMMAPKAKGLFHRAWSLSGSPIFNKTIEQAKKENAGAFLQPNSTIKRKCDYVSEQCLRSLRYSKDYLHFSLNYA
jgi:carboxylesterase type B